MKRDMNNKERRKVVVRGKKKTYTRTMLVKTAQDIGRRESLHQIKLEQANHQPSTMSRLLAKAKSGIKGVLPNRNVGALHALHPWQEHHTKDVDARNSQLGGVQKFYGTSGPGSDHSLFAHMVGASRNRYQSTQDREVDSGTYEHARSRREQGSMAATWAPYAYPHGHGEHALGMDDNLYVHREAVNTHGRDLASVFQSQVQYMGRNPTKWVR